MLTEVLLLIYGIGVLPTYFFFEMEIGNSLVERGMQPKVDPLLIVVLAAVWPLSVTVLLLVRWHQKRH